VRTPRAGRVPAVRDARRARRAPRRSAIADYEHLSGYLRDLYQTPGVAETVDIAQIQRHYYVMHHSIKPNGIVPAGPELDFSSPHGRERL
jgi:putative glutathione S-transferase